VHFRAPVHQGAEALDKTAEKEVVRAEDEGLVDRYGYRRVVHRGSQRTDDRRLRQVAV